MNIDRRNDLENCIFDRLENNIKQLRKDIKDLKSIEYAIAILIGVQISNFILLIYFNL